MRAVPFICLNSIELSNESRVLSYVENLQNYVQAHSDCACESLGLPADFVSPSADPAPWYSSARPDSSEFLGLWAHDIRILSTLSRSSNQRARGGATLGPQQLTQRIVQVEGLMFASTARGMAYGERWMEEVLAGDDCGADCIPGTLELLPACPIGLEGATSVLVDAEAYWLAEDHDSDSPGLSTLEDRTGNGHDAVKVGGLYRKHKAAQYAWFPADGGSIRADDVPYNSIVGDHDIRLAIAPENWATFGSDQTFVAKWGAAGQRSIRLTLLTGSGNLRLQWSTDGTAIQTATSTAPPVGVVASDLWGIRVVLDVNDGGGNHVVSFYKKVLSQDGSDVAEIEDNDDWTLIGAAVTTAGTTSVFDSTSPWEIGASTLGTIDPLEARVFRVLLAEGTDVTKTNIIADADFTNVDNVKDPFQSFGDGINRWEVVQPVAGQQPIVLVDRDLFVMDVDSYFEVPDAAGLDFAAGEDFTIAVAYRHGPLGGDTVLLAKKTADGTTDGYLLLQRDAAGDSRGRFTIADGVDRSQDESNPVGDGATTVLVGVRNDATDRVTAYDNGVASSTSSIDNTTDLTNAEVLRIGRFSGAASDNPSTWVFLGAAVFRRVLSPSEVSVLSDELIGGTPIGAQYFRSLRQVGIIQEPEYEPVEELAECFLQRVSFQLAAGIPHLLAPEIKVLDEIQIAAGGEVFVSLNTAEWVGDAGSILTIEARDGDISDVEITARVTLDGTCTEDSGGPPCVHYTIPILPYKHVLTIDSISRQVFDFDPTMKRNVSGMAYMEWGGRFPWLEVAACTNLCVRIENNGGEAMVVSLSQFNREL